MTGDAVVGRYGTKGKATKKTKKASTSTSTGKDKKRKLNSSTEGSKLKKTRTCHSEPTVSKGTSLKKAQEEHSEFNSSGSDSEPDDEYSDSETDLSNVDEEERKKRARGQQKHLEKLKIRLGLTDRDFADNERTHKKEQKEEKVVFTAAGKPKREPEIVIFEDPAKRKDIVSLKLCLSHPVGIILIKSASYQNCYYLVIELMYFFSEGI